MNFPESLLLINRRLFLAKRRKDLGRYVQSVKTNGNVGTGMRRVWKILIYSGPWLGWKGGKGKPLVYEDLNHNVELSCSSS